MKEANAYKSVYWLLLLHCSRGVSLLSRWWKLGRSPPESWVARGARGYLAHSALTTAAEVFKPSVWWQPQWVWRGGCEECSILWLFTFCGLLQHRKSPDIFPFFLLGWVLLCYPMEKPQSVYLVFTPNHSKWFTTRENGSHPLGAALASPSVALALEQP